MKTARRFAALSIGVAWTLGMAGCGPCVEHGVELTTEANYGTQLLSLRSKVKESVAVNDADWNYLKSVAQDISEADLRSDLWGVAGGSNGLNYIFGFRLRSPRTEGEQLQWDPSMDQFEQEFAVVNSREEGLNTSGLVVANRIVTEATLEVVSASPTILRFDALYTPTATSSDTEAIRMTGDIHFDVVGNSLICETP